MRKNQTSQIKRHSTKTLDHFLKLSKVMKKKERVRNCHRPVETKELGQLIDLVT